MHNQKHIARDISYSHSAETRPGRAIIRVMENVTGRIRLIKRAEGYEQDIANGRGFWDVMVDRFGLSLDILSGSLDNIPKTGPLIVVANHPYGILDGLLMGHILSHVRGDFRILANDVFARSDDLKRTILPISFDETKEALRLNLETRKTSLSYLADGGAIGVFPGGTVSTAAGRKKPPMDPKWRSFTAKMVAKSQATVVPIYFDGENSKLFQYASRLHYTLRMGLLIKEFKRRVDEPARIVIGDPIGRDVLDRFKGDNAAMMDFLRKSTYDLSPHPNKSYEFGYEFEAKHRA